MKTINVHQVDAFTSELFGGNPAGIVTNASELSDDDMIKIAREMNLSETAFVLPATTPDADVRLRFFTPEAAEIQFCGHATVGTLFQLARLNMYDLGKPGTNDVRVETGAGVLHMSVTNDERGTRVSFTAPRTQMEAYRLQGEQFAEEFGVPAGSLKSDGTVLVDRKLNYVYIPIVSLERLGELQFDFTRVRERFGAEGVVVFCFFTGETKRGADLQARGLAPNVGIDEDPFTGSMQAGLVQAAKRNKLIPQEQVEVTVEQGDFVGRPGSATITHDITTDTTQVTAGAVPVFSTNMELPS